MYDNRLKLNATKTEFPVIGSDTNRAKAQIEYIQVDNDTVKAAKTAKNLGIPIDQALSLENRGGCENMLISYQRAMVHTQLPIRKHSKKYRTFSNHL